MGFMGFLLARDVTWTMQSATKNVKVYFQEGYGLELYNKAKANLDEHIKENYKAYKIDELLA